MTGAKGRLRSAALAVAGKEDGWTEEATAALIAAWGDRFLRLFRSPLRQSDWLEISSDVNAAGVLAGGGVGMAFLPKTDAQCKSRIDALKKRYKSESSRPTPALSSWPYFSLLRRILSDKDKPEDCGAPSPSESRRRNLGGSAAAMTKPMKKRARMAGVGGVEEAMRGLARAVARFGEIYERVEWERREKMAELEQQRMDFTKELEFKKMEMLMNAQLEIEKMKRPNQSSSSSGQSLPFHLYFSILFYFLNVRAITMHLNIKDKLNLANWIIILKCRSLHVRIKSVGG